MNIQTVIANLHNTINGKLQLKSKLHALLNTSSDPESRAAIQATADVVRINVDELSAILRDLEQCSNTQE